MNYEIIILLVWHGINDNMILTFCCLLNLFALNLREDLVLHLVKLPGFENPLTITIVHVRYQFLLVIPTNVTCQLQLQIH